MILNLLLDGLCPMTKQPEIHLGSKICIEVYLTTTDKGFASQNF